MAGASARWVDIGSDDDLFEIDMQRRPSARLPRGFPANFLNPAQPLHALAMPQPATTTTTTTTTTTRARPSRPPDRRSVLRPQASSPAFGSAAPSPAPPTTMPPAVIDLTEEPDSPPQQEPWRTNASVTSATGAASFPGRHPRRTNSQRASPPRLARSDNSLFDPVANIIDLTVETPDIGGPPRPPRLRGSRAQALRPGFPSAHHGPAHRSSRSDNHDRLVEVEFLNGSNGFLRQLAGSLQTVAGIFHQDYLRGVGAGGGVGVGVRAARMDADVVPVVPFNMRRDSSPKVVMEDVPPARHGFTRDTLSSSSSTNKKEGGVDEKKDGSKQGESEGESEMIVICPACGEELAYDPTDAAGPGSAGKGRKRKRAPGEHHFWALKKCGHVYCADCFESRRPTKSHPQGAGFQSLSGKPALSAPHDLRCAVEGCETKVTNRAEWVGIFL